MASMKDLLARAKATRDAAVPHVDVPAEAESFRLPRCKTCGAPREAQPGAVVGALAGSCRFCGTA